MTRETVRTSCKPGLSNQCLDSKPFSAVLCCRNGLKKVSGRCRGTGRAPPNRWRGQAPSRSGVGVWAGFCEAEMECQKPVQFDFHVFHFRVRCSLAGAIPVCAQLRRGTPQVSGLGQPDAAKDPRVHDSQPLRSQFGGCDAQRKYE